jgi:hypothetical protein
MAFKLFRKGRKRKVEAEPVEMEAVQEDEGDAVQLEPGQPVPYDVPSWLPPGKESHYQRGSAVVSLPDRVVLDERLRGPREEKVHVVRAPPAGPVNQATHECLNCGFFFKVPYRRPVRVTCPDCGAEDELR